METAEQTTTEQPTQPKQDAYVATLNLKSIGCEPRDCFTNRTMVKAPDGSSIPGGENPRGVTPLAKIWGRAASLKHGENRRDSSVWTALSGKFSALNIKSGMVYNSGKLFLPAGIQDLVESAVIEIQRLIESGKAVEGDVTVQFAFEIRSKTADNPIGYTYEAVNLMPIETQSEPDPLRAFILEGKPMGAPKQLEAAQAVATAGASEAAQAAGQTERRSRNR